MSGRGLRHWAVGLAVVAASSSCAGGAGPADPSDGVVGGTVSVLAASSLTEVMDELASAFERGHPGVRVRVSAAGSSLLAAQILEGVPADLFVAADEETLARVADAGLMSPPVQTIATNALQIVVASGNPHGVRGIQDLDGDLTVALCRSEVPCGAYADRAFRSLGREPPRAGRLDDVKAVLARVQLGEADAGVVYRTDVVGAAGVMGVDLGRAESITATYPASVLANAIHREAAQRFLAFLVGGEAQAILRAAGFGPP